MKRTKFHSNFNKLHSRKRNLDLNWNNYKRNLEKEPTICQESDEHSIKKRKSRFEITKENEEKNNSFALNLIKIHIKII